MPGTLPAALNSPLAQSPMNCMAALPLMTMPVAWFQLRLGESLSMYLRTVATVAKIFSMVGLLRLAWSSSTIALR